MYSWTEWLRAIKYCSRLKLSGAAYFFSLICFVISAILANNLDSVLFKLYDKSKVSNSEESNKWLFIFAKYKDILLPATNNNSVQTKDSMLNPAAPKQSVDQAYDEVDEPI
jgi:glucan phosphoethanolaminetransferase (alkaline phosphatase superfamily)